MRIRGGLLPFCFLFVIAALNFSLSHSLLAADGDLDLSFDADGMVITDLGATDLGNAVAIQSDGKIVVVGRSNDDFALTRYNADGSLDTTFSGDGIVTTTFNPSSNDFATAIAIQSDGKIVAAGASNNDFAIARYNSDGSLDTTFSSDGLVTTTFLDVSVDIVYGVGIQSDGKIVAVGSSTNDFALARFNPDGSLDTSFSSGKFRTDFSGGSNDIAYAVAIQSDGKIIAVGASNNDFALARYNSDGTPDSSFSSDGLVTTDFLRSGSDDRAYAVALQANGKIVAAGYSDYGHSDGQSDFGVARYYPNGTLDKSFSGGTVTAGFSGGSADVAFGVAVQTDGKIVATGSSSNDFAVARFTVTGGLDNTFSGDGLVTTDFGGTNFAQGVAIETAGEIVAVGSSNGADFALARYIVNAPDAKGEKYHTPTDTTLTINAPGVLRNDTDPDGDNLTAVLQSGTSNGSLILNPDGSFTYTPALGYNGPDSFTYVANDGTNDSNVATVSISVGCLLCDDFEDGVLDPNWTYSDLNWNEDNGFLLVDAPKRKSTALGPIIGGSRGHGPIIGGTRLAAKIISAGGPNNKIWMLGWYTDEKNKMELLIKEENDKVILKQHVNGVVVQKESASATILPNTPYSFAVEYDGTVFTVTMDRTLLFTLTPIGSVSIGNAAGFRVKNTTGLFDDIEVF